MIGTKFSKYFKQDILDRNQTLKPVIIIPEIEEVWGASDAIEHKKLRAKYSFTINQEKLTIARALDSSVDGSLFHDYRLGFSVNEKISAKKLIQELASASPYIPRFSKGGFKLDVIKDSYGEDPDINSASLPTATLLIPVIFVYNELVPTAVL